MNGLLSIAIEASIEAGQEILKVYNTDFEVEYKEDKSPLTLADKKANDIIMSYLKDTGIPVLSEEGKSVPYVERKHWKELWIVDPLDGTKEFVKKNGEFTVNIALVRDGIPVMGVVYAPVLDQIYYGDVTNGAFKSEGVSSETEDFKPISIPVSGNNDFFSVVASRSHLSPETKEFIDNIKKNYGNVQIVSKGSSLKICMVAEGTANIYPRFAPTMEWDTAAGHAVIRSAGKRIVCAEDENKELEYNKENLVNPWFIVK